MTSASLCATLTSTTVLPITPGFEFCALRLNLSSVKLLVIDRSESSYPGFASTSDFPGGSLLWWQDCSSLCDVHLHSQSTKVRVKRLREVSSTPEEASCFAHGHLYVGLSRVTRYDKISLLVNWSQQYTDLCPSPSKTIYLHLKPLLQNIVYPEAINEIQTLTDAYDAERLQETTAAGGLGAVATGGLGPASSELLA